MGIEPRAERIAPRTHIYLERAASGCVPPSGPEGLPGNQGSLMHYRPNLPTIQTTSSVLFPVLVSEVTHPHRIAGVVACSLVYCSSPCHSAPSPLLGDPQWIATG